eukprot:scaffold281_cov318-Pavlova_lutheri.AAC.2
MAASAMTSTFVGTAVHAKARVSHAKAGRRAALTTRCGAYDEELVATAANETSRSRPSPGEGCTSRVRATVERREKKKRTRSSTTGRGERAGLSLSTTNGWDRACIDECAWKGMGIHSKGDRDVGETVQRARS